jgi:translation initiation factor IF-3
MIRDKEVRLIGVHGELIGVVSSIEAKRLADQEGVDLVKISPNANPPVCKIMDYGKYKFEQQKKAKEQKKANKQAVIKEIQLSMVIQKNDIDIRIKHAKEFLNDGNKIKVVLKMKGREQANTGVAVEKVKAFYEELKDLAIIDAPAARLGRNVIMVIAPNKK